MIRNCTRVGVVLLIGLFALTAGAAGTVSAADGGSSVASFQDDEMDDGDEMDGEDEMDGDEMNDSVNGDDEMEGDDGEMGDGDDMDDEDMSDGDDMDDEEMNDDEDMESDEMSDTDDDDGLLGNVGLIAAGALVVTGLVGVVAVRRLSS